MAVKSGKQIIHVDKLLGAWDPQNPKTYNGLGNRMRSCVSDNHMVMSHPQRFTNGSDGISYYDMDVDGTTRTDNVFTSFHEIVDLAKVAGGSNATGGVWTIMMWIKIPPGADHSQFTGGLHCLLRPGARNYTGQGLQYPHPAKRRPVFLLEPFEKNIDGTDTQVYALQVLSPRDNVVYGLNPPYFGETDDPDYDTRYKEQHLVKDEWHCIIYTNERLSQWENDYGSVTSNNGKSPRIYINNVNVYDDQYLFDHPDIVLSLEGIGRDANNATGGPATPAGQGDDFFGSPDGVFADGLTSSVVPASADVHLGAVYIWGKDFDRDEVTEAYNFHKKLYRPND